MNVESYVHDLSDITESPKLFGVPTGTKLDELFKKISFVDGKPSVRPLGGLPSYSVINVTGIADTGKSILAEQFAVVQASNGYRVLFVTVESPVQFLRSSLEQRAEALGVSFGDVEKNISVIDASQNFELRENLSTFLNTLQYAIKSRSTTVTIIDSITGLYESKEMMARQTVRSIYNALKSNRQTAMLISQKRSYQGYETAETAGGLAVVHIVDGTIVVSKRIIESKRDSEMYGIPLGDVLRTIRIDGCRMAPHDDRTYVFEISTSGLIEIKSRLDEILRR